MDMWLVRGHMFLGVGRTSQKLLVRVGEARVGQLLAQKHAGVKRCTSESGRTFPGTLMIEPEAYRGDERLAKWFALATSHNESMDAKAPADRPKKRRVVPRPPSPSERRGCIEDDEVLEAESFDGDESPEPMARPVAVCNAAAADQGGGEEAPTRRRPASTASPAFARCVLEVVTCIPKGKVAAYGQIAALAGAPRNARQVGALLRDGLCAGGAPWHRVLGAAGKVSLPATAGGDEQRRRLAAEGVEFGSSGAVAQSAFWSRTAPFFV
jgi:methylated-DNA-protein-cysteine methyltransferase-like protein